MKYHLKALGIGLSIVLTFALTISLLVGIGYLANKFTLVFYLVLFLGIVGISYSIGLYTLEG